MSADPAVGAEVQWAAYSDARCGLTLEHPADWRPAPGMTGLLVAIVGSRGTAGFASNLNVVRRVNDVQVSLDDLARSAIREVKRVLTDVAIIDLDHAVVSESPARRLLFTYRQGMFGLTGEQWVWVTREHIWTVTAGAATEEYDKVADVFSRTVGSLRIADR